MNSKIAMILVVSFLCLMVPHSTMSQISISNANSSASNYDEIEAEGMKCRNGLTGPTQIEFGVGQQQEELGITDRYESSTNNSGNAVVYGKITYSFGMPKRLNCSRLYDLQILILQEKLRALMEDSQD